VGGEIDIVVFAGAEKEAGLAVDGGVVIAAQSETILERDALGGVGRQGDGDERSEGSESGEAVLEERELHEFRVPVKQ
jgi:hypothetical protein